MRYNNQMKPIKTKEHSSNFDCRRDWKKIETKLTTRNCYWTSSSLNTKQFSLTVTFLLFLPFSLIVSFFFHWDCGRAKNSILRLVFNSTSFCAFNRGSWIRRKTRWKSACNVGHMMVFMAVSGVNSVQHLLEHFDSPFI